MEKPSRVILETCSEAFAIADQASAAGHDVRVVASTLVRALGVGQRGIKTDQRDARCLSEASVRMDLGSVHIPSDLAREMKTSCAMRAVIVKSRTSVINSVRGWLRAQLLRPKTGAPASFPGRVRAHLVTSKRDAPPYVERQLLVVDALTEQIHAADDELKELATRSPEAQRLMTIPGVGPTIAVYFLATIDKVDRFANAHHLESYLGLTPGEQSSSDSKYRTGLTKAGSAAVRSLMIQAAWSAFRTRKHDPMVLWAKNIADKSGKTNVAIVALARKMVGIMFALLRHGTNYQPSRASTARETPKTPVPGPVAEGVEVLELARAAMDEDITAPSPMTSADARPPKPSAMVRRMRARRAQPTATTTDAPPQVPPPETERPPLASAARSQPSTPDAALRKPRRGSMTPRRP
jgi:transposase